MVLEHGMLKEKIISNLVLQILIGFICDARISGNNMNLEWFRMLCPTTWASYIYSQKKGSDIQEMEMR